MMASCKGARAHTYISSRALFSGSVFGPLDWDYKKRKDPQLGIVDK
jgi:hypothetical protein